MSGLSNIQQKFVIKLISYNDGCPLLPSLSEQVVYFKILLPPGIPGSFPGPADLVLDHYKTNIFNPPLHNPL